jgi:4a-hydroxytetrahydrobiopterin dehydratase
MTELTQKKCQVCEGGIPALERAEVERLLPQVPGWTANAAATEISRGYKFKNYYETMAFVNALAWIAHREDHHPDLEVGYSRCLVRYSTHAVGGLTENDFICAAKLNALTDAN